MGRKLWTTVVPLIFLTYIILFFAQTVVNYFVPSKHIVPAQLESAGAEIRLNQKWRMFAANPTHRSLWVTASGRTKSGKAVTLIAPSADKFTRPQPLSIMHADNRWVKFSDNLGRFPLLLTPFGQYLCTSAKNTMRSVDTYIITQQTLPNNTFAKPQMYRHTHTDCTTP